MGTILTNQANQVNSDKLINVIYCDKCHKTYWFNDYHKHIVNCNAIKKHKNNKIISKWENHSLRKI